MSTEQDQNIKEGGDTASSCTKTENENSLGGPSFYPPLYTQRYSFVKEICDKLQPESVVDFGCSECGIFRHLKEVASLLRISMVDIDSDTLEFNKNRIRPRCYDYLQRRKNPLHVQIMEGSATDFDETFADYDAVVMVEFIEHLYDEDLKKVVKMVFGCIHPRFVVMTTPNYEFNQLFPGPPRFRHYDHKFEWTRQQFQEWCYEICETYRYSCEFHGVDEGPPDSSDLGCCSQAAVLTRKGDKKRSTSDVKTTSYKLIAECTYPHQEPDNRNFEEILQSELTYTLSFASKCTHFLNEDESMAYIPIKKILQFKKIENLCNEEQLRDFLKKKKYVISSNDDNDDCVVVDLYPYDAKELWYGDDDVTNDEIENDITNQQKQEVTIRENIRVDEEELWE